MVFPGLITVMILITPSNILVQIHCIEMLIIQVFNKDFHGLPTVHCKQSKLNMDPPCKQDLALGDWLAGTGMQATAHH